MFGGTFIDVAIGLVFIFLILSLTVTAAQEALASVLRRRSRMLKFGIANLLRDPVAVERLYQHPLIKSLSHREGLVPEWAKGQLERGPSYIPSRIFALALLDQVTAHGDAIQRPGSESPPRPAWAEILRVLQTEADGGDKKLTEQVEVWFNHGMERVSGWYKRQTQAILLGLGLLLAVALNADTIDMANALWRNPALRASLVASAEAAVRSPGQLDIRPEDVGRPPPPPPFPPEEGPEEAAEARFQLRLQQLQTLRLPLGWNGPFLGDGLWRESGRHGFGWLLTAFAISLGAPFWFDVLNKVVSVRAAGKAPEEKQKSPKEEQQPLGPGERPADARNQR